MTNGDNRPQPVLLLHPWGSTGQTTWGRVASALRSEGINAKPIDLPGHGSGGGIEFSWRSAIDAVGDAVRELGEGPVTVVGLSLGAAVALHAAREMPSMVHGVVLCGAALSFRPIIVRASLQAMGRVAAGLGSIGVWRPLAKAAGHIDKDDQRAAAAQLARGSPRQLVRAADALAHFDATSWSLTNIRAQVIVFTADKRMPPQLQRELAHRVGATPIEVVADHDAPVRQPAAVVDAVRTALANLN
jgi:pimeloyl-ACP methyl ester carboxylesterase